MGLDKKHNEWMGEVVGFDTIEVEAVANPVTEVVVLGSEQSVPVYIEINGKRFPLEGMAAALSENDNSYRGKVAASPDVAREIQEWVASGHQIITIPSYPTCPTCGATGDDDWDYCPFDGARLDPAGEPERHEVDRYGKRVEPGENDG